MDYIIDQLSSREKSDNSEWHTQLRKSIVNSPARNNLTNLFNNLYFYSREGRRIKNGWCSKPQTASPYQERSMTANKITGRKIVLEMFPDRIYNIRSKRGTANEYYNYEGLYTTREKSKELIDFGTINRKQLQHTISPLREYRSCRVRHTSHSTRPASRGLEHLCAGTVRYILFPVANMHSPLTKMKKKEHEYVLRRRLRLLRSCYRDEE